MADRFQTFEVLVPLADEDSATAVLWECGTVGVQVEERAGALALIASFARDDGLADRLAAALGDVAGARWREIALPDVDWVARFREDFRGFPIGGFQVVPEWDGGAPGPDAIVVDPGRAFGTGTHETTRLCVALIEEEAARRPLGRTLDVGAGTGILGVVALRRGAVLAVASDLDPEATASSALHARLNRVPLAVVQADGGTAFRAAAFDLVLANLMAPLLIERSAELRRLCAPAATLVLSGLLTEDVEAVSRAYSAGAVDVRIHGEWAALRVRLP